MDEASRNLNQRPDGNFSESYLIFANLRRIFECFENVEKIVNQADPLKFEKEFFG